MVKQGSRKSGKKSGKKSGARLGPKSTLKAPPRVQDLAAHAVDAAAEAVEAQGIDEIDGDDAAPEELDEIDAVDADADEPDDEVPAEAGATEEPASESRENDDEAAAELPGSAEGAEAELSEGADESSAELSEGTEASGADLSEGTETAGAESPDAGDAQALVADDALTAMLAEFDASRPSAPPGVKLSDELPIDPEDDLRQVEGEASLRLVSIIESLLFAAAKPLRVQELRKLLAETSKHQIQLALKHLIAATVQRGVVLAQVAGGFQYRTHPDNAVWVQKMLQARPARLSRTQIETLAIVAYRQPITRPEIDEVRGVDSGAVLKTLLERDLIQIVGRKEEPGRPLLYGTTVRFLEFFNLRSLRDLPTLRDFRDLSEESKATLRAKLGQNEAEALGQEVLELADDDSEGTDPEAATEAIDEAIDGSAAVDTTEKAAHPGADDGAAEEVAASESPGVASASEEHDEVVEHDEVIEPGTAGQASELAVDALVEDVAEHQVTADVAEDERAGSASPDEPGGEAAVEVGEASDAEAATPEGAPDHDDERPEEA